ncbi:MAG TPA: glycosyltransferase family A protein, partial [Allosphingosinicella sp.]
MSATPAVSVVLPVHNGRDFVETSIRSVLAQDFTDFELVVGDDGSDDGTDEVLAKLAAEDVRIRLLRRPSKSGLARSANWVISEARAPLVAIAHADDIYDP